MACDWLSIVGSKGRKASAPNQTESHVEQVVMDNESKVAYVRAVMENLPMLAKSPVPRTGGRPQKGEGLGAIHITRCMVSTPARRPGAKHTSLRQAHRHEYSRWQGRPKVTKNGHSERSNLTVALQRRPEQGTTRKRCREGWPKACPEQPALSAAEGKPKEANAQGNAWDTLTWAGCQGG